MIPQPTKVTRQELYDLVWSKTLKAIAAERGTTYVQLVTACQVLHVPRPQAGHWDRVRLGLPVEQVPLPEAGPEVPNETILKPKLVFDELPEELPAEEAPTAPATEAADQDAGPQEPAASNAEQVVESRDNKTDQRDASGGEAPAKQQKPEMPAPEPERPRVVEYTREELYEAIWSKPCLKLAAELGISDVALAKTCRRLGVPRPPRGYWARVEAGEKLPRVRLPAAKEGQDVTVRFDVRENAARRREWAANHVLTAGRGKRPEPVALPAEGSELHPIVERHGRALERAKPDELGFVRVQGKDLFDCYVSLAMVPRLLRAMDAVIGELEDRDFDFETGADEYEGLRIIRDGDRAGLDWREACLELEREPTEAEKRRPSWTWQLKERKPSGQLSVEVSAWGLRGKRRWTEGEEHPLEEVLGVVVEKVEATFRGFEDRRKREAEWARQREEEAKREAERRAKEAQLRAEEEKRRKELERLQRHQAQLESIAEARRENLAIAAQQWMEAQGVSAFIDCCEARWRQAGGGELSQEQLDWLAWARAEVGRMGPFAKGYPNPAVDGKLDGSGIPVGGPYPEVRQLKKAAPPPPPAPAATEAKTVYVQPPPEPYPFWLRHR